MPRGDGTGPNGYGAMTGRGLGVCTDGSTVNSRCGMGYGLGRGIGCRRGLGRGFGMGFATNNTLSKSQKELLQEQKNLLERRLKIVSKEIENL